jgi:arginine decarboxylase
MSLDEDSRVGERLHELRPELDRYLMTVVSVEQIAGRLSSDFRRVFHAREGALELHLSLLCGVEQRYRAPFFEALKEYSRKPTGVFHAMPISRGKSLVTSHWIRDMIDFYGTSATYGGLDSLLEPTGPLREAQELAGQTFGSRQTFFVTNGTSGANKIVVEALVQPGDIVLVDRNCHQSHQTWILLKSSQSPAVTASAATHPALVMRSPNNPLPQPTPVVPPDQGALAHAGARRCTTPRKGRLA